MHKKNFIKSIPALAGAAMLLSTSAMAAPIDLSTWTATSGGTWNVQGGGTSVLQTTNGQPTFFLSDIEYIDKEFNGTFGVETTSDDDYIGFVFGYDSSTDFLLFDWKQGDQSGASEGFTLSQISGNSVDYWNHTGSDINVLASDYGNNGWADNTTYNFTLDFTTTGIKIDIDGNNIFDVSGSFDSGKFGFYNYSQSQVRYTGFEETVSESVPEPGTLAILSMGLFGMLLRNKRS